MFRGALIGVLALLVSVAHAQAATLTDRDRYTGALVTLTDRVMTVSFPAPGSPGETSNTRRALAEVQGRRVTMVCAEYLGVPAINRALAMGTWPSGARTFALVLPRDVSAVASSCLLEQSPGGRDVTGANFSGRLRVVERRPGARNRYVSAISTRRLGSPRSVPGGLQLNATRHVAPGRYRIRASQRRCLDRRCHRKAATQRCLTTVRVKRGATTRVRLRVGFSAGCSLRI